MEGGQTNIMDTTSNRAQDAAQAKTVEINREELYELVWTVPMQRLAERYGISDCAWTSNPRPARIISEPMSAATPSRSPWRCRAS